MTCLSRMPRWGCHADEIRSWLMARPEMGSAFMASVSASGWRMCKGRAARSRRVTVGQWDTSGTSVGHVGGGWGWLGVVQATLLSERFRSPAARPVPMSVYEISPAVDSLGQPCVWYLHMTVVVVVVMVVVVMEDSKCGSSSMSI